MRSQYEQMIDNLLYQIDHWPMQQDALEDACMSNKLYPYTHLFSPVQVNQLKLKNRIVMGPMGNISAAEEMGRPSRRMVDYFAERARGGVGLLTSGLVPVSQTIDPTVTEVGDRSYFPRIDRSRTVFAGWRDIAEAVHAYGAHFFIQLTVGLGRVGSPECLVNKYKLPVSASWNPNYYIPQVPCRPLTDCECRRIIRAMGQAAADAKALLIDGVYLHGHEGYLLEQMTNSAFNHRKLSHYANWKTFGLEVVREIRKRVGSHYPLMYRIDLSLALNATYGKRMDSLNHLRRFKNERTVEMTLDYMIDLVKEGIDLFDVDLGCYDNWWLPHPPNSVHSGCFLKVSKIVKDFFTEEAIQSNVGLPVPIVGVGKLGYPDLAEKALRDGMCDLIMLARPLLADPEWANKAHSGKTIEIIPCIGDQEGCINEFIEGGRSQCSVNPRTGFEDVYERELIRTQNPKKIAIVGAGPAGIMAGVTAARRGHQVVLYEQRSQVGGMLVPGSRPKIKYEISNYLSYLKNLVERTIDYHDLQLILNTSADSNLLKEGKFDSIIIAVGGKPILPSVPGVNSANVIQAADIFQDPRLVNEAQKIVIIGGGMVGCECAHFLAWELHKDVILVEMLPGLMKGICTANRSHLIRTLELAGVQLLNCTTLKRIEVNRVFVDRNISKTVPTPYNTWQPLLPENVKNPLAKPIRQEIVEQSLETDLVVLAVGLRPDQMLYDSCIRESVSPEIFHIGDAFQPARVFEAVKAGFSIGRTI